MRCFLALELPPAVDAALVDLVAGMRGAGDVSWTGAGRFHVTLVFAGALDPGTAAALGEDLEALPRPPLALALGVPGAFPPRGAPRVLWLGLVGDTAALADLQARAAAIAARHGVVPERRPFSPHVTVGRVRGPRGARHLLPRLQVLAAGLDRAPFRPPALTFFRSEPGPGGSRYTPLHRLLLA